MQRIPTWTTSLALALLLVIAGCDSVDDGTEGEASLSVLMTDAPFPFDLVESAEVTITGVSVETDAEGRVELFDGSETLNLLDLVGGVTTQLADEVDVPAGVYERILVEVSRASVTLDNGETFEVTVPSGTIRVLLGDIVLDEGEAATILLDFDVSRSFVVQGNPSTPAGINGFIFKPVIRPLGYLSDDDDDDFEGAELQGEIEEVGEDYIEIAGIQYLITDDTEIEDDATLMEGMIVEIEFVERVDGERVATEIDVEDDDDRGVREVYGLVTGIEVVDGRTFIVLDETSLEVTAATKFDDISGIDALMVDESVVEIDYVTNAEGDGWVAVEVELADDYDDDDD